MGLEEKLKQIALKKEGDKTSENNWNEQKNIWLHHVEQLYTDIQEWLNPYSKYIRFYFNEIRLSEENIGEYNVRVLEIDLGEPLVVFRPIGRNIIGAHGRIDIYASGHSDDRKNLLLIKNDNGNFNWELRLGEDRGDLRIFDKSTLEEVLEDLLKYY